MVWTLTYTTGTNLKGARIATLGIGHAASGQPVSLPVPAEALANGIYLVKVSTDSTVLTQRLVTSR